MGKSNCWAESLGGCDGGISGEHLFTAALFGPVIHVSGFPWCKDKPKAIGRDNFTANVLCRKHNSALSLYDQAVVDFWNLLKEFSRLGDQRKKIKGPLRGTVDMAFNALPLEAWCLKTCINIFVSGNNSLVKDWTPKPSLVKAAFGISSLPEGCGIGMYGAPGFNISMKDHMSFFVLGQNEDPIGAVIGHRGIRLVFSWLVPVEKINPALVGTESNAAIVHHQRFLNYQDLKLRLRFDWSGKFNNDRDKLILRLRK